MKIKNDIIEENAVKIFSSFLPVNNCQNFIKIASTEQSFDGYINFFENRNTSKKGNMTPIPIQIKGTTENYNENKFNIDVSDLKNYLSSGVCIFVIKMILNEHNINVVSYRILGRSIIGLEANDLIKENPNNETISVEMYEIKNENELISLFKLYKTKAITISLTDYIDFERFKKGEVILFTQKGEIENDPKLGETYFAKFKDDEKEAFAHNFKILSSSTSINKIISIKNKIYFESYESQSNYKGGQRFKFNEALTLDITKDGFKIELNKNAKIQSYIHSLSFLCDMLNERVFSIGNLNFPVLNNDIIKNKMINFYSNLFFISNSIYSFFKSVRYDKEFSLGELKKEDIEIIAKVFNTYQNNCVQHCLIRISLFNKVIFKVMSQNKILFFDIFHPSLYKVVKFKSENDIQKTTTPFITLTLEEWSYMDLSPIEDFQFIIENYVSNNNNVISEYKQVINILLIAYKKTNRKTLYDYANFLNIHFSFGFDLKRIYDDIK